MKEVKKPFYKKWWFITIVVIYALSMVAYLSGDDVVEEEPDIIETAAPKVEKKTEPELTEEEKAELEKKNAEEIERKIAELEAEAEAKAKLKAEEADNAASTEVNEEEINKIVNKNTIESAVRTIIKDDLKNTSVRQLLVNENMAKDDGSYIVLPHLKWDVKNGAKTTREMLEMYSDHLAAKLAEQSDVSEITVFWEVPHHVKDDNIAKYMYERSGGGMAKVDKWIAPVIQ